MKYDLKTLIKPDNADKLKDFGRLENLDKLEKIFDTDAELSKYITDNVLEIIGRCGKITYIAMLTIENEEMTANQIRDLVNKVFQKKWTTKAVKSYLERLILMNLVSVRYDLFKTLYRLRNRSEIDCNVLIKTDSVARAKLALRKDSIKKRF